MWIHDTYCEWQFSCGNFRVYLSHLAEPRVVDESLMSLCQQFTNEVDFATRMRQTICTAQNISHSYLECQVPPCTINLQLPCLLL